MGVSYNICYIDDPLSNMASRSEVCVCVCITYPKHASVFPPQILRLYRRLHRTCRKVFVNDDVALNGQLLSSITLRPTMHSFSLHGHFSVFRERIKSDFWKNRDVTEQETLSEVSSNNNFIRSLHLHVVGAFSVA